MKCNKCGFENNDDAKFCNWCGEKIIIEEEKKEENKCPICGSANTADAKYCAVCGSQMSAKVVTQEPVYQQTNNKKVQSEDKFGTSSMVVGIVGSTIMLSVIDGSFASRVVVDFDILHNTFYGIFGIILLSYLTPIIAIASPLFSLSNRKPIKRPKENV